MLSRHAVSIRNAHHSAAKAAKQPLAKVNKLENGAIVGSLENYGPLAQLVIAFKAGSRYEEPNESGLVHTVRSFVGNDSQKYPAISINWAMGQNGAKVRSFANREVFGVQLTAPRNNLQNLLDVAAQTVVPAFKPWEIEDVLPNMRIDNVNRTSYVYAFEGIHRAAYRNGGLANSIYSPCSQIGNISHTQLEEFSKKYLTQQNSVIFGINADHETLDLYARNYNPIQVGTAINTSKASPYKGGEYRKDADNKYAHVIIAGEGASSKNAKAVATQAVLLTALGNSSPVKFSSVPHGIIGKTIGQNASFSAFQSIHSDSGLAGVYVVVEPKFAKETVNNIVGALKSIKIADFDAVKIQAYNNALRAKAHSDNYCVDRASQLILNVEDHISIIPQVTLGDVEAAAKKLVEKLSLSSYGNISEVPYVDTL